jgi:hypothetical protein
MFGIISLNNNLILVFMVFEAAAIFSGNLLLHNERQPYFLSMTESAAAILHLSGAALLSVFFMNCCAIAVRGRLNSALRIGDDNVSVADSDFV